MKPASHILDSIQRRHKKERALFGECRRCVDEPRASWGRSPLCFECLQEAQLLVDRLGAVVDPRAGDARGPFYAARYRFKRVRCGKKDCGRCAAGGRGHYWYVYRQWRVDGRAMQKYLGPSNEEGEAYELPTLRAPQASIFGARRS